MTARNRLVVAIVAVLALNAVATIVAVVLNLPSQFGGVGTDASAELVARGTAISAPLLPVVLLVIAALLVRRGRWAFMGTVIASLTAVLMGIGGIGELTAEATPDVSKPVLVGSGAVAVLLAIALVVLSAAAALEVMRAPSQDREPAR